MQPDGSGVRRGARVEGDWVHAPNFTRLSSTDPVRLSRLWVAELLFLHESERILSIRSDVAFPSGDTLLEVAEGVDAVPMGPPAAPPSEQ